MPDSAFNRPGSLGVLRPIMQDHLDDMLVNVQFPRMPFFYMLFARDGDKDGIYGLGRPKVDGESGSGILVTSISAEKARKTTIWGSLTWQPIIRYKRRPKSTQIITSLHGNQPQVDDWQDNTFPTQLYRPTFRWVTVNTAYSASVDELRFTRRAAGGNSTEGGWEAVGNLLTAETQDRLTEHVDDINSRLLSTGAGPSNTDADYWDDFFTIKDSLGTSNTYGGVDRSLSANAWFQGNQVTASTQFVARDLFNYANYSTSGPQLHKFGLVADVMFVNGDLFVKALEEANSRGARMQVMNKLPNMGSYGLETDMVKVDDRYWIVHEPSIPAGHAALLNLNTWVLAIHPDATFTVTGPYDQRERVGGPRMLAGNIESQIMLACVWPAGNVYWTNLT